MLFAGQGADNDEEAPRRIEPAFLFVLAVMNGQAAVGRVQARETVVRGIEPYPELIEKMGHRTLIVKPIPRIGNRIKDKKTKAYEQLNMGDIKNLRHLLIVPGTGDDDKGINEVAHIDGNHEGQEGNGLVERRQRKLDGFEQGKPVRQYVREDVGRPDQVIGEEIFLLADNQGRHQNGSAMEGGLNGSITVFSPVEAISGIRDKNHQGKPLRRGENPPVGPIHIIADKFDKNRKTA